MPTPVTIIASGGTPVTNTTGASPFTPVDSGGVPVTLVGSGGFPVTLVNNDLTLWSDGPTIELSASTAAENAASGTKVGTLSLDGDYTGTPTFTLDDSAGGKFAIDGDDLETAGALDYETATSHVVTVSVSGIDPAIDPQDFTITVTNEYDFTNSEAAAWVAAFTSEPSDAVKGYYDTFVGALKAASIWTKMDVLWWLGGPDSQASRINAKDPGNLTLGLVSSPTHTAYRGFTCNGSSSYLTTGYNPTTFGGQYTLNSAHMSVYSRTEGQLNTTDIGCRVSSSDDFAAVALRNTSDLAACRLNQDVNTGPFPPSTTALGFFVGRRSASNALKMYRNGSSLGTGTEVSQAIPNLEIFIGAINQNGSAAQFSAREYLFASVGGSLTDAEVTAFTNAVAAFATSIGANV